MMPSEWRPEHKLFPHQVGFTCPPFDFDAAPSDFSRIAPETVGVHGWMLHVQITFMALISGNRILECWTIFAIVCHEMARTSPPKLDQIGYMPAD